MDACVCVRERERETEREGEIVKRNELTGTDIYIDRWIATDRYEKTG